LPDAICAAMHWRTPENRMRGFCIEDFLIARGHGDDDKPRHRQPASPKSSGAGPFSSGLWWQRPARPPPATDLNAEERPERIDSAERIDNALIKKVAPQGDDNGAGQQNSGHPAGTAKGFQTRPPRSCTIKRPTRVPASSTVSIKSASNIMAKWYQMLRRRSPPMVLEKI